MTTESAPDQVEMSGDQFRAAFRHHPAGVAIVTANGPNGPVGLTATSVSSVSAEPPIFIFSVAASSSSLPAIRATESIVVNLLDSTQTPLARLFATSGVDRFADQSVWSRLDTGEPYLTGVHTWIRGEIVKRIELGGSVVVAVRATHALIEEGDHPEPLVYHNRTWHGLGHASRLPEV